MTPRAKMPAVVAGYARCSTIEQQREGVTLDAQADRIARYCEAHGLTLGHIYTDAGVSGGVPLAQRPEGRALVDAIGRREVGAVVSLKLDRLFRSTLDCLETVKRWDGQCVALTLIDFAGGALDTKTAMGKFFLTMAAGFGELERQMIGERTSSALQHLKRQGVRLGGVPFGFTTETPGGPLVPMPCELAAVREILRLRGAGGTQASYRAIARHLTAASRPTRHGGVWKAETVRRIVHRRGLYDDLDDGRADRPFAERSAR